jgi:ferric-dicitrate binding protein FerR (iron transport regulator)
MSDQDPLASLLRAGGPRPMPSPERLTRAREVVRAEWGAAVAHTRTRRRRWLSAAALVAAVSAVGLFAVLRTTPVPVATLARLSGEVVLHSERGVPSASPLIGQPLYSGDAIETAATGRALVGWSDVATLRIDGDSRARFASEIELQLTRGKLYVETDEKAQGGAAFVVSTQYGEVRHVGTRFEVRVAENQVRVRVRDGVAVFEGNADPPLVIEAGRELSVVDGVASLEQGPAPWDPAWAWTHAIAPELAIEGRSLFDALEWLAHEAGMRVSYESPAVRDRTRAVVLHGSIEGIELRQALTAVLSGSGVAYQLHGDRIEVRESESP